METPLKQRLNEVLEGAKTSIAEIRLFESIANTEERRRLDSIAGEILSKHVPMSTALSESIQDFWRKNVAEPEPPSAATTPDEVRKVLRKEHRASIAALNSILSRREELGLDYNDECKLRELITERVAEAIARTRNPRRRRAQLADQMLDLDPEFGFISTPAGLLRAEENLMIKRIEDAGIQTITACRHHDSNRCSCWRDQRDLLYKIKQQYGEGSPQAWRATEAWTTLEDVGATQGRGESADLEYP